MRAESPAHWRRVDATIARAGGANQTGSKNNRRRYGGGLSGCPEARRHGTLGRARFPAHPAGLVRHGEETSPAPALTPVWGLGIFPAMNTLVQSESAAAELPPQDHWSLLTWLQGRL